MSETPTGSLFTILIALERDHLILPNVAVIEVGGIDNLKPVADVPAWWLGNLEREGQPVPLIDFEVLNGAEPLPPRRARAVFLHLPGPRLRVPAVAVLSRGYPHLVSITPDTLAALPLRETDLAEKVLARVRIGGTEAGVPDLDAIEAALVEAGASILE